MPKSNLNQNFDSFQAKLPRTDFQVGRDIYFTSSCGQILPIWFDVLNPGERIHFNAGLKTITQPLLRPAMMNIDQKIELFFVPFSKILTYFPQLFYQTNDYISCDSVGRASNFEDGDFPVFDIKNAFIVDNIADFNEPAKIVSSSFDVFEENEFDISYFDSFGKGAYRLLMHLGFNPNCICDKRWNINNFSRWTPKVFPYQLAAYQCIYQDWYRNDDRERRDMVYSLDSLVDNASSYLYTNLLQLRYHQRPKDYFTSLRVSPIMSVLNLKSDNASANVVLDGLKRVNNYLDNLGVTDGSPDENEDNTSNRNITQFVSFGNLTTGALRSLFAVEKYMRITGRARKNYDSQTLAHFGIKVPHDVKHELTRIGILEGNIGIQTVMSTAGTENTELGERAGTGNGSIKGRALDFTAPVHGVVMAVYYAVPRPTYPLGMTFDKINAITNRLDMFIPEFDRLGMQPVYNYETTLLLDESASQDYFQNIQLGWQYRYEQYKRKYDVHTLAFLRNMEVVGVTNDWSPYVIGQRPFRSYFEKTAIHPSDVEYISDMIPDASAFMCAPTDLNDLFVQNYKTTADADDLAKPWLMFATDPFMHACNIDCIKVSSMSTTGEPELE